MRAELRALFDDDDGERRRALFQPDRRGETRGPAADNHDIEIKLFALHRSSASLS